MITGRLRAFDWLRGLAVLVMVQTHALVLLNPSLRVGPFFRWLNFVDGLVAPSFLFASGFSLSLTQVRAAQKGEQRARFRKTLLRIIEVLFVACLLNWMWFPVFREPHWWLRLDILHCLGLNLLLLLPLASVLSTRPRVLASVMVGLAVIAFGVSPLVENVTGFPGIFLNEKSGSLFPLLPWAGHICLGAAFGAIAAAESRRALLLSLAAFAAAGYGIYKATPLIVPLYPPHDVWRTNIGPHGARVLWVTLLALLLSLIEGRVKGKNPVLAFIERFGTSSLSAYFFHLFFLYYEVVKGLSFRAQWLGKLEWPGYVAATAALIALTWVAVRLWDPVDARLRKPRAKV